MLKDFGVEGMQSHVVLLTSEQYLIICDDLALQCKESGKLADASHSASQPVGEPHPFPSPLLEGLPFDPNVTAHEVLQFFSGRPQLSIVPDVASGLYAYDSWSNSWRTI